MTAFTVVGTLVVLSILGLWLFSVIGDNFDRSLHEFRSPPPVRPSTGLRVAAAPPVSGEPTRGGCPRGHVNDDDAAFCKVCGTRLPAPSQGVDFSLDADRRRNANRQTQETRKMLAIASRYGSHSGSASDTRTFVELFERFATLVPGASVQNVEEVGPRVAAEAAGSQYPLAAHAAWAVASLLPSTTVSAITQAMGMKGMVAGATVFTDEFPGLVKVPILGNRSKLWRGPAAIAAVLLGAYADELGIA